MQGDTPIDYNNINHQYYLEGQPLLSVCEEKDIGVIIDSTLKSSKQCLAAVKKANQILDMINRLFEYKSVQC